MNTLIAVGIKKNSNGTTRVSEPSTNASCVNLLTKQQ